MAIQGRGLPRLQDLPPNTEFLDDSNTALLTLTPPFTRALNNTCAGGTCTQLGSSNASLAFSFQGSDVWLFGQPGGIVRVFLDGQLVDVLDSSTLPNNGSALWAANNMSYGEHTVKLAGVDPAGLNLLIDFFEVGGIVDTPSNTTTTADPNYLSPDKLTAVIIGSLVGFFSVIAVIGISIMLYLRRKRRRRISKSAIKLRSSDSSTGHGGRRSTLTRGSKSVVGGIFPWRSSAEKRPQIDLSGDEGVAEGRSSDSTDGGNPFLRSQYAFANSNAMATAYSPPSTADASVPLFAHPGSPEQQEQRKQHQMHISFVQEPTTAPPFSTVPVPPSQPPPQPPLEAQRQIQLEKLRVINQASQYTPTTGSPNSLLGPERARLMGTPPPGYRQQPQQSQTQHLHQDPASLYRPSERAEQIDYIITNLPPRGTGGGSKWSAPTVSMASFSTTYTPAIIPTPQLDAVPGAESPTENDRLAIPDALKSQSYESLPPSFKSFDPPQHAGTSTGSAPPLPSLPPKLDTNTSKSPLSNWKGLKGPRPRGGSTSQPATASTTEERRGAQFGVGTLAGNGAGVRGLRPEDEDPESPIDPAVNSQSQWY